MNNYCFNMNLISIPRQDHFQEFITQAFNVKHETSS